MSAPAELDPLATLLVPFLVSRTAALGEAAQRARDPERALAEVPDWGWVLGVVASAMGLGLAGERRERDGLALLARALDGALAAEGRSLGAPRAPWPELAPGAEDGWSAAWAVGRVLLWAARGANPEGAGADLALCWEQGSEHVVLRARAGLPDQALELTRSLARRTPAVVLTFAGKRCALSLPAAWFAGPQSC